MLIVEERNLIEELGKKSIELDEQFPYSSSRLGCGGYRSEENHNNRRSQCHGTNRCLEDGMIPPEQVVPLEATREVEEKQCGGKANNHHERGCC